MNYELAKELKDAGFPLPEYPETIIGTRGSEPLKLKGIIQEPTLSELIEACGEAFGSITKMFKPDDGLFRAVSYSGKIIKTGRTPEEAVARLWLKLNE